MKKQINKSILYLTVVLCSILLSSFVIGDNPPLIPHSFSGTAKAGTTNISASTIITARVNGVVKGSIVMDRAGFYGNLSSIPKLYLSVGGSSSDELIGQTITFYIGCAAANTSTWSEGSFTTLNLQLASGTAYCGDGSCNGGESVGSTNTCTSTQNICNIDCGSSSSSTSSTGSGGSGSGSTSAAGGGGGAVSAAPTVVSDVSTISLILQGISPSALGLESLSSSDVTVTVVKEAVTVSKPTSVESIGESLDLATSEAAKEALAELKTAVSEGKASAMDFTKSLEVFKVKSKETGKTVIVSLIQTEFVAPKDCKNLKIIETVPKTMAESAKEVNFINLQPTTILQADPIFEFMFSEAKAGDKKLIKYTLNKELSAITSKTVGTFEAVSAEKPSEPVLPPVEKKPMTGFIIAGIVVLLGLIIYFVYAKRKQGL